MHESCFGWCSRVHYLWWTREPFSDHNQSIHCTLGGFVSGNRSTNLSPSGQQAHLLVKKQWTWEPSSGFLLVLRPREKVLCPRLQGLAFLPPLFAWYFKSTNHMPSPLFVDPQRDNYSMVLVHQLPHLLSFLCSFCGSLFTSFEWTNYSYQLACCS